MALARLDHVIYSVPDIEAAHGKLTERFPEAWPIGRFWPNGITCGVALGGLNLELIQMDEDAPTEPIGLTLVFEPTSIDEAVAALERCDVRSGDVFEKFEIDSSLL